MKQIEAGTRVRTFVNSNWWTGTVTIRSADHRPPLGDAGWYDWKPRWKYRVRWDDTDLETWEYHDDLSVVRPSIDRFDRYVEAVDTWLGAAFANHPYLCYTVLGVGCIIIWLVVLLLGGIPWT